MEKKYLIGLGSVRVPLIIPYKRVQDSAEEDGLMSLEECKDLVAAWFRANADAVDKMTDDKFHLIEVNNLNIADAINGPS